jgi:thioredoxin 1
MSVELNESNFDAETGSGLVLVDFFATWCPPCKALAPIFEQVTGIKLVKVNADNAPNLASKYQVSSIPKLVFLRNGEVVDQMAGLQSLTTIQARVDELRAEPVDGQTVQYGANGEIQ